MIPNRRMCGRVLVRGATAVSGRRYPIQWKRASAYLSHKPRSHIQRCTSITKRQIRVVTSPGAPLISGGDADLEQNAVVRGFIGTNVSGRCVGVKRTESHTFGKVSYLVKRILISWLTGYPILKGVCIEAMILLLKITI